MIFLVTILNSPELCKVRRDFDGLQTIDRQVFLKDLREIQVVLCKRRQSYG